MTVPLIATQSEFLSSWRACQRPCLGPRPQSDPASWPPGPAGGLQARCLHFLPRRFIPPQPSACNSCVGISGFA